MKLRRTGNLPYLIFLWFALSPVLFAQQEERIQWGDGSPGLQVVQSGRTIMRVQVKVPGASFMRREAAAGSFVSLSFRGMARSGTPGVPDLPVFRRLLTLPAGGEAVVEKVTYRTRQVSLKEKFPGRKLFPRQLSPPKNGVKQQHFDYNRRIYRRNAWVGDSLVTLRAAGIMRGEKLIMLTIAPFRYNPAKDLLEVYEEVEVTIRFTGTSTAKSAATTASAFFTAPQDAAINSPAAEVPAGIVRAPVRYLILTDTLFRNTLEEFVRWKTEKGYRVEEIFLTDPGVGSTSDSIKNYLNTLYHTATPENPAPVFLLIVGDTPQVPVSATVGHVTDLYYATYDGPDDYLPDLYYGRIPARDTTELRVMLNKILEYEKYRFPDPSFLTRAVMVAGVDGTYAARWGNGQINYANRYYVNGAHGYDPSIFLYPESGDLDAEIRNEISEGVSLVNYTGHGVSTGWLDPSFRISDIADLHNAHEYPLFITNGCKTATFGDDECFAEALVRADNKGALAYIGCSNDSYWDEDYFWSVGVGPIVAEPSYEETSLAAYDRLYHDHGEPPEDWYITADQIIFAGNMEVMTGNPARSKYYWEIYHLLGDPSLMPYFAEPASLAVHMPDKIPAGTGTLTVVTEPYAFVGLTCGDTLLDAVLAGDNGTVSLSFPLLPDTAALLVTVTRQNRIPVQDTVLLLPNTSPYISVTQVAPDDTPGNGNGLIENGEEIFLDLTVLNSGITGISGITGKLSSSSPWVVMVDSLSSVFTLAQKEKKLLEHAFVFHVKDSIPDGVLVTFHLSFEDNTGNAWDHWFTLTLHAPVPVIGHIRIDDLSGGNGNLRLDPGESVNFILELGNEGQASLAEGYLFSSFTNSLVISSCDSTFFAALQPGERKEVSFPAVIDAGAPYASQLQVAVRMQSGGYMKTDTFFFPIGLVYEDFETGDLLACPWENDPSHPWMVTEETAGHGAFSAVSGRISDGQSTVLQVKCKAAEHDSLSFYYRVSSEEDYDFLRFSIDGEKKDEWSGNTEWVRVVYPVTAGDHTFTWTYYKDGNTTKGLDRAWIDYIVFPAGCFTGIDAGLSELVAPGSAPDLGMEDVTVIVKNFGRETLQSIPLVFRFNDGPPLRDTLTRSLAPGDTVRYTFPQPVDMSVLKSYRLYLATEVPGDQMPVNNTIHTTVTHKGVIDVALDSLIAPARDSVYTAFEKIIVSVINASSGAVDSFPLYYCVDEGPAVFQSFDTVLAAGDTGIFTFDRTVDMADTGQYIITVYTAFPGDSKQGNDTLTVILYNTILKVHTPRFAGTIRLYPNPAGERITLRPSFPGKAWTLLLTDMEGRKILLREQMGWSAGEEISLPLTGLAPGTYFILLTDGQQRITLLFIKR